MNIILFILIVILAGLQIFSLRRNAIVIREKAQLVQVRDAALNIANHVVNTRDPSELYQYILESCLKIIPKAKYGSILMLNAEGLLTPKASVGFHRDDIGSFKLKPEESYLYIASNGKLDRTMIINRLDDIKTPKNKVRSEQDGNYIQSTVSAPLRINGELVGMLCIDGDQNGIFTEQDIFTLDYMANQVGVVIRNQRLYSEILRLSRYDSLSNLLNRDSFEHEAEKLLKDPSKDAGNLYFILMDLDELKRANDTIGHHFGDEVIKSFSETIKKYLGKNDLFGRYGGDEFAAIIQGNHLNIGHALEDAKKEFMEKKIGLLTNDFVPSFSYGMASFLESEFSLDTLYRLADKRMYETKRKRHKEH